jgi:hypothetical protein
VATDDWGASVVVVGASVVVVDGGSVVVVGGSVVTVVVGAWYALRCDDSLMPRACNLLTRAWGCDEPPRSWVRNVAIAVVVARGACAVPLCSKRRGRPNNAPHDTAATPKRLPRALCFRRAPPFSGDSAAAPTEGRRGVYFDLR